MSSLAGTTCIILAGGLGTRLRSAVPEVPKCLAPVAGKPFLYWVITQLQQEGIRHFIFSLGYRHEDIEQYLQQSFPDLLCTIVLEPAPLGTGGAIRLAMVSCKEDHCFVTNGDTLFTASLSELSRVHLQSGAIATLALKPMQDYDRYGTVLMEESGRITGFTEKRRMTAGNINGGLYALHKNRFLQETQPGVFSFEKDFLEARVQTLPMSGCIQDAYFIDIGIPEDFEKANRELAKKPDTFSWLNIQPDWTLFLDRDGVINEEKHQDYIHTWDEFRFMPGSLEAISILSRYFKRIIVVTNQKGVGKGLTKLDDLHTIHANMEKAIQAAGGKLDAVFYCSDLDDNSPFRKPNPGMGLQAIQQFPDISPSKALMVGNTLSDMEFGRNLGVFTVFLPTTRPEVDIHDSRIDRVFPTLLDFARAIEQIEKQG